jgi:hypothetical protein
MRTNGGITSLVIRSIIFCFVVAAFAPARRRAAPASSFSRASLGFCASVMITVILLMALGAALPPAADAAPLGLRGTI